MGDSWFLAIYNGQSSYFRAKVFSASRILLSNSYLYSGAKNQVNQIGCRAWTIAGSCSSSARESSDGTDRRGSLKSNVRYHWTHTAVFSISLPSCSVYLP